MTSLALMRGAAALALLVFVSILGGTGIALAMAYVPSQAEAFDSMLYLRRQGGLGALIRALHYHLSSGAVVAAFLWVLSSLLTEEHRERKWEFRASVVVLLLMIGFCFTGYLLPMDQNAYWGTSVRLGIVETVPVVGGLQADMLRGGPSFGAATLPRFYALHASALPLVLLAFTLLAFREALERAAAKGIARIAAYSTGIALLALVVAFSFPAPLEPRANPADTEYIPRPEWYFLWLFQFGKYVHSFQWVESALLPAAAIGTLLALPDLKTTPRQRLAGATAALGAMFGLGALALYEDRDLPERPQYEAGLVQRAERNWKVECVSCHGEAGRGDGPDIAKLITDVTDLTAEDYWDDGTRTQMIRTIRTGNAPDMPAFGDRMTEEEILALADFIETRFKPKGRAQ
jgi:ubiquinol-cytochrome c reductase cytochrome b subunit